MERFELMATFVRVVDAGSITGAADAMNIAKSAVSRRLSELEAHLGVQLLNRTTRAITPTQTGRSYYEQCVRILDDVAEVESSIAEEVNALKGQLRVAAPLSFGLLHLGDAILDFKAQHPEIEFDIDFNDRRVDVVQDGFDVVIRIGELKDSNLIARRLTTMQHEVCASPGYLMKNGTPAHPGDLRRHSILQYSQRVERSWSWVDNNGKQKSVNVTPTLLASNGDFLVEAASRGEGIILEPTFLTYRAVRTGRLTPILTDFEWQSFGCYAVYPPSRHLSHRVRAFVDFLADRYEGLPYWDLAAEDD